MLVVLPDYSRDIFSFAVVKLIKTIMITVELI